MLHHHPLIPCLGLLQPTAPLHHLSPSTRADAQTLCSPAESNSNVHPHPNPPAGWILGSRLP